MDILSILTLAVMSPATGDRFPVIPLVIIIGLAVVIAIVTSVIASRNRNDDDE